MKILEINFIRFSSIFSTSRSGQNHNNSRHCGERHSLVLATKQPQFMGEIMPFYVYITANRNNTVLYTGVTNNLKKRIVEHKLKLHSGFTKKYHVDKLVYYEVFEHAIDAISREKQIKGGSRQKKVDLIRNVNRKYEDLASKL